jgi:L-cysteine S-thiosulfotransferase
VTLIDALNDCRVANGEEAYKVGDTKTMGYLTAYMRTLSDGMLMNIKVEGPKAMAAYNDGKKSFYQLARASSTSPAPTATCRTAASSCVPS